MKISNRNRIKSRKMLHKHLHIIALFLYIFSYTHPVKAQDINSGLVGWWRLDETSGTSISDNSNTGNIGTWQTPPDVNSASGKIGRAIDFVDANGNYILIPDNPSITGVFNGGATISAWINARSAATSGSRILHKGDNGNNLGFDFEIAPNAGGQISFNHGFTTSTAGGIWTSSYPSSNYNQWHHVALVYDCSDISNDPLIYIDGASVTVTETVAPPAASICESSPGQSLAIGAKNNGNRRFNGLIDDVRIYNRSLTPIEIQALYQLRNENICAGNQDTGKIIYDTNYRLMKYCDGATWVNMGKEASIIHGAKTREANYNINAVTFDANTYLIGGSPVQNSKKITGSVWLKKDNPGSTGTISETIGNQVNFFSNSSDNIRLTIRGLNLGTDALVFTVPNGALSDGQWHHLLFSADVNGADASNVHVYLDDTDAGATIDTLLDDDLYLNATWEISDNIAGARWVGSMADYWLSSDVYLDLSIEANRRKFINADGQAIFLGNDGSRPTGSAPRIFLSGDTASWHINKGAAGGFSENGSLTDAATTPPSEYQKKMLAWWRLDETGGSTATDSSGENNSGSMQNGLTGNTSVQAPVNRGLTFDGTDDYISTGTVLDLKNKSFSIALWAKRDQLGNNDWFLNVTETTSNNKALHIGLRGNNRFRFGFYANDLDTTIYTSLDWHHWTVTYDANTKERKIFRDGVEVASDVSPSNFQGVASLEIGRFNIDYYEGSLDDIRIYNYAFTDAEVEELYASSSIVLPYVPNAVNLAGEDPQRIRNGCCSNTDGTAFSGSFWIRFTDWPEYNQYIMDSNGENRIYFQTDGDLFFYFRSDSLADRVVLAADTNLSDNAWHHIIYSFDVSNPANSHVYLDDVSVSLNTTTTNGTIDFNPTNLTLMGSKNGSGNSPTAEIANFWFDYNTYIDLSVEANRRDFIDSSGYPVDLGSDGSTPTGSAPDIFLSNPASSFGTNLGSGGGFGLVEGTFTDVDGPAGSGVVPRYCSNPSQPEGTLIYNSSDNVMQYCDGYQYIPLGPQGNGGGSCSSPYGVAGSLIFNSDFKTLQYCEGNEWIGIGGDPTANILAEGLIGHWKLDETTGTIAIDSTGSGFNGTMSGGLDAATNSITDGAIGRALDFNGSSNYIDLGTSAALQPSNLTVSAWVKRNAAWSYSTMIFNTKGSGTYTDDGWYLEILNGNQLALAVDGGNRATANLTYPLGTWIHVAATFDDANDEIKMYVDGVEVPTSLSGTPTSITSSSANKYIARNTGGTVIQSASLDDIRIYDRALSESQILALALENAPIPKWDYLSTGWGYVCGITNAGDAKCWGRNANGNIGNGTTINSARPTNVDGGYKWKTISAGYTHSCGVRDDDSAMCWGLNTDGPLGNGTTTNSNIPVLVSGGHDWIVVEAAGADNHSCGITTSNIARCWGDGYGYALGESGQTDRYVPNTVRDGYTWTDVDVGFWFGCGVTTEPTNNGRCWGANSVGTEGRLGYGGTNSRNWPNRITGGHTWLKISNGDYWHGCGIISDGRAKCWGYNSEGEVGDGTNTQRLGTVFVSGGHTWSEITTGYYHSCGIRTDGTAMCWGSNIVGQLGDGSTTQSFVPVEVQGGYIWKSITAGYYSTCGIRSDDVAMCWGYNAWGQLGNGTTVTSTIPVLVR